MDTTRNAPVPPYLGVDVTDRYAKRPRPIDVCGLLPVGGTLEAHFWQWTWDPAGQPIELGALLPELSESRAVLIDAPQGLAMPGKTARECDRLAPGKVPDRLPPDGRPYAGFIRSSVELFRAIHAAGIPVSTADGHGTGEMLPARTWMRMAGKRKLPKKTTPAGRCARRALLEGLGRIELPADPTHDQLDAASGALLAAAVDGLVPGLDVEKIGLPLHVDDDGTLREGPMLLPVVQDAARERVEWEASGGSPKSSAAEPLELPRGLAGDELAAAQSMLDKLAKRVEGGQPTLCTYAHAAELLFGCDWSQGALVSLLKVARATTPCLCPGLGRVRLDTFLVAKDTGEPGEGHWEVAAYSPQEWRRIFAQAELL